MTHDPLCRRAKITEVFMEGCPECALIAKVREQRIKTHEGCADAERIEGYVDGYADALDAAREAVASISGQGVFVPRIYKHVALTAIDALKEKQ